MPMCKSDFKDAFREVVTNEFDFIPLNDDEIKYEFTSFFENKMNKLILKQKKFYYDFTNTAIKKVVVMFLIFLTMLLVACSIEPIRKPIVNFFMEFFDDSVRYTFNGDVVDKITNQYTIKGIPEGFEQVEYSIDSNEVFYEYKNSSGEQIFFNQVITSSADISFDREHGKIYSIQVDGMTVEIYESPNTKQALWLEDGYMMHIVCYGNIEVDTLKFLIENVGLK